MVDPPDVDIPRPNFPERRIIFGDGYQAQLVQSREGEKDKEGNEIVIFWIKPLEHLRWTYNIQDKDYTNRQQWWIKKSYPADKCYCINKSPFTTTWLILLTYDGKEKLSVAGINKALEIRCEEYRKEAELLHKILARTRYRLKMLANQPDALYDKTISDLRKTLDAIGPKQPEVSQEGEEYEH